VFDNALVGSAKSSVPHDVKIDLVFIAFRIFGSVVLVPALEELFWRGWLMRWFIRPDFEAIRLGHPHTLLVLGDSSPVCR
jgi:hypothetical protein